MNAGVILGVLAIVAGPLGGYLVTSRKLSGKISTTEATRLWDASEQLRAEYRDDLEKATARIAELEARIAAFERINDELRQRIRDLGGGDA